MNGIIIVDKPPGWTSQDVVSKLRGILRERRIGHGGTLDPMATGVLPVFIGRATRAVQFFESADKEYIAGLRLGITTDTQDITGEVRSRCEADVQRERLEAVLSEFHGEIMQTPPMYSAVKVNGQRLYQIARRGGEVERAARKITVYNAELTGGGGNEYTLRFVVSKGTYVRTLCADIGEKLGVGGVMSALRRTRAGAYGIENAATLDEIEAARDMGRLTDILLPTESVFAALPSIEVDEGLEANIRHGRQVAELNFPDGRYRVYNSRGEFIALTEIKPGKTEILKSFFEVEG